MEKYCGYRRTPWLTRAISVLVWIFFLCRDDDVRTLAEKRVEAVFPDSRFKEETNLNEKCVQCSK